MSLGFESEAWLQVLKPSADQCPKPIGLAKTHLVIHIQPISRTRGLRGGTGLAPNLSAIAFLDANSYVNFRQGLSLRLLHTRSSANPASNNAQVVGSGTVGTLSAGTGCKPARSYCALVSNTTAPLTGVTS